MCENVIAHSAAIARGGQAKYTDKNLKLQCVLEPKKETIGSNTVYDADIWIRNWWRYLVVQSCAP